MMKKVFIYIPGIHEDRLRGPFNYISTILKQQNDVVEYFCPWGSTKNLEELTLEDIHHKLEDLLREYEKYEVILLGRSFGGAVILTSKISIAKKIYLFAPAITFSEDNLFQEKIKFKFIKKMKDNLINKSKINSLNSEITIYHDKKDPKIDFENSAKISKECDNVTLIESSCGHDFINFSQIPKGE